MGWYNHTAPFLGSVKYAGIDYAGPHNLHQIACMAAIYPRIWRARVYTGCVVFAYTLCVWIEMADIMEYKVCSCLCTAPLNGIQVGRQRKLRVSRKAELRVVTRCAARFSQRACTCT